MVERRDVIANNEIGKVNLFPRDYKIGIYVPLSVLFFYPLVLFLKGMLFGKSRKTKKVE